MPDKVPPVAVKSAPTFKRYDNVVAAVELKSGAGEGAWAVHVGTPGHVRLVYENRLFEVQFENGVIRLCKPDEIGKAK